MVRNTHRAASLAACVTGTIGAALICFYLFRASETVAALILILATLIVGSLGNRLNAVVTSFVAALCLDVLFIPPILKLTIATTSGWVGLFVFLAASLFVSTLSAALRRQRDELAQRQLQSERLHALSRALLLSDRGDDMRRLLVNKCIELFGFEEAVLFELASGEFWRSSSSGTIALDELRRVATYSSPESNEQGTHIIPIMLGNKTFGSLGYRGPQLTEEATHSLSNTLATGFAQAQAHEAGMHADAVRRSEELKSVMIDALAHDLKTPLTAIEIAAETLIHMPSIQQEQSTILLEEIAGAAKGLRRLVHGAIHLARIDAKRLHLDFEPVSVAEIVQAAIGSVGERAASHLIAVEIGPEITPVLADSELLVQALKQLIDNALKYSPSRSVITVSATQSEGLVSMSVRDQGAGLTELEQSRVFEKFYRGRHDGSSVQGTGMGLAIAKEIAEAHGGGVSVESQVGQGTRFTITLRAAGMEQPA